MSPTACAEFHVRFDRGYHVGAGHGRGTSLDSALFTEPLGGVETPAVRYAHGILRQAVFDLLQTPALERWRRCPASGLPRQPGASTAAEYCTRDEVPCPICRIFGSAAWPSPWDISTMRPVEGAPGARVISRASVDPRTRRARDATLFSEELGAPAVFRFHASRRDARVGEETLDELAFLVAAARTVSAIGADRRRGRGECEVTLHEFRGAGAGVDGATLLSRFFTSWIKRDPKDGGTPLRGPALLTPDLDAAPAVWTRRDGAPRVAVRLVLRLEEPLAVGARPLTGNVLEGERFVPGTLLLGAFAGLALRGGAAQSEFLRAFRGGGLLVPDLLPVAERDGRYHPVLPAPADLFTCGLCPGPRATGGHGFWSPVLEDGGEAHPSDRPFSSVRCPECRRELEELEAGTPPIDIEAEIRRRQAKAQRVGDVVAAGGTSYALRAAMRSETKIQVDPATGRVQDRSLYHREVIAAGTVLEGTLLADADSLAFLEARKLLAGPDDSLPLHLGKRSGRGYGRATLGWARVSEDERKAERDATRRRAKARLDAGGSVPVMLASRLVARDGLGRAYRSLEPEALGLSGTGRCAVHWGAVGGFWRHVGLPRRQDFALLAGSVLHLDVPDDAAARDALLDRLVELEHGEPRGDRTAEGFGRVVVDPFPYGWMRGDAVDSARDLPIPLRPASAPKDAAGVAAGLPRDLEGLFDRDEWRAVARYLYAHAVDTVPDLIGALETGRDGPQAALKRVGGGRTPKSFLKDGKGQAGWKKLRAVLEKIAGESGPGPERAAAVRALADAIAGDITPGKGTDG
ncbi:MAG: hypothetical protein JWM27_1192 [Gemmatimonadetes bacterium]|nr:hypothetical protein [Gemmatimonadota bacterium]